MWTWHQAQARFPAAQIALHADSWLTPHVLCLFLFQRETWLAVKPFTLGFRHVSGRKRTMVGCVPEILHFAKNGWVPSNARLPVLIYRGVIDVSEDDPAAAFEAMFERNGWPPQWRDTIFT